MGLFTQILKLNNFLGNWLGGHGSCGPPLVRPWSSDLTRNLISTSAYPDSTSKVFKQFIPSMLVSVEEKYPEVPA